MSQNRTSKYLSGQIKLFKDENRMKRQPIYAYEITQQITPTENT